MKRIYVYPLTVLTLWLAGGFATVSADEGQVVSNGREVALEYTLRLDDGSTADSNVGDEPLVYVHGQQQLLPALEAELEGMSAGESKEVTLAPNQAYGPVEQELIQEVDPEVIPEDAREAGQVLVGHDPQGMPFQVRIVEVHDDAIVVDFNHPLAGENLHFAVTVLEVR